MNDDDERPIRYQIEHEHDVAWLLIELEAGQQVLAEPRSMIAMDTAVELTAGFEGGLRASLSRALAGESLSLSTYFAPSGGQVCLAPGPAGDIVHVRLRGERLRLAAGSFLACSPTISLSASWEGARGFFSGTGAVLLEASGAGDLWFSASGAILPLEVQGEMYVDTGFVAAFEQRLTYRLTTLPGLQLTDRIRNTLLGGDGLVCSFEGEGRLWLQTRAPVPLLNWLSSS